jgi:asparaginyl-tRNA synthetase
MVEPEVAFLDMEGLVELAEDFVIAIVKHVLSERRSELELLERNLDDLERVEKPFYRIRYSDAIDLLHSQKAQEHLQAKLEERKQRLTLCEKNIEEWTEQSQTAKKQWQKDKLAQQIIEAREETAELREQIENIPHHMELAANFTWGKDLGGSDETIISEMHDKPVCVTHYPKEVKAFYMRLDRDDPRVVENLDVLASQGYGEIIGGSMREEDFDTLKNRIKEFGLNQADYEWYLDLRRYGSVKHGGFGLGVERTVAWLTGIKHIRETIAYPRMMGKLYP